MTTLYLTDHKIITNGGKLAISDRCCCDHCDNDYVVVLSGIDEVWDGTYTLKYQNTDSCLWAADVNTCTTHSRIELGILCVSDLNYVEINLTLIEDSTDGTTGGAILQYKKDDVTSIECSSAHTLTHFESLGIGSVCGPYTDATAVVVASSNKCCPCCAPCTCTALKHFEDLSSISLKITGLGSDMAGGCPCSLLNSCFNLNTKVGSAALGEIIFSDLRVGSSEGTICETALQVKFTCYDFLSPNKFRVSIHISHNSNTFDWIKYYPCASTSYLKTYTNSDAQFGPFICDTTGTTLVISEGACT